MSKDRLTQAVDLAYSAMMKKLNGGRIVVETEASLQLQFASILKVVGELLEAERDEFFTIELEKPIKHADALFGKSGSERAKIDVYCAYTNASTKETHGCAVEMKFFKKKNQREPNNRYDVFADLHNLENYGAIAEQCYMIVATDHPHYVTWPEYSKDTCDFDFRHGSLYTAGTTAAYRTAKPYGPPIKLDGSYSFNWDQATAGLNFLKVQVRPRRAAPLGIKPSQYHNLRQDVGIPISPFSSLERKLSLLRRLSPLEGHVVRVVFNCSFSSLMSESTACMGNIPSMESMESMGNILKVEATAPQPVIFGPKGKNADRFIVAEGSQISTRAVLHGVGRRLDVGSAR